jgi:NAD(P)-dependent dehydrogenase (short-subunit alcohol dehydrogenase family)
MPSSAAPTERPLSGRHAIVTGASRGIGLAVVNELARLGADITLLARDLTVVEKNREAVMAAHGVKAAALACDVASEASVNAAFEQAVALLGKPQILINNAGVSGSAPFHKMSAEHWRQMMAANLDGVFYASRAAVPLMLGGDYGRIVTIASITGLKGSAYIAAYSASKHGAVGLTRSLAMELATKHITVNAICPGYVATDMTERTIDNIVAKTGRTREDALAGVLKAERQARLVTPEEVAATAGFLCLPAAAAITGEAISLTGGEI